MMKRALVTVVLCLTGGMCLADGPTEKLVFKNNGFSIAPLDESAKGTHQVLAMFLPSSDGFAPNVNVQIQPFSGTRDEYAALSKKQFKARSITLLSESNMFENELTFEYSGEMNGSALHWYAKAVLKPGKVILVTATSTQDQWKEVSGKLKACVESFEAAGSQPQTQPETRPDGSHNPLSGKRP